MKKILFIAVAVFFTSTGCKFLSKSVGNKPQLEVKKQKTANLPGKKTGAEKKPGIASEPGPAVQKKPVLRSERGFTLAFKALSEVCTFVPGHVDAMFFASGKEARYIINSLASGIPILTNMRRAPRFFRMLGHRFGLKDADKVADIMVVETGGQVIVFARGIGIGLKNRESYTSGKYKFVLSKLPDIKILSGLFNGWVVIGARDAVLKLAARRPRDARDNCARLKKRITTALGPNMYRDPFNIAVGCVIPFSATIFWDSSLGMRVLAPVKGNQKGIQAITGFVRALKQSFSQLQAESDAGAPALHPVSRMRDADMAVITMKENSRAGMFMLDAHGSLVDLLLAVYQQKLRPFIGKISGSGR